MLLACSKKYLVGSFLSTHFVELKLIRCLHLVFFSYAASFIILLLYTNFKMVKYFASK